MDPYIPSIYIESNTELPLLANFAATKAEIDIAISNHVPAFGSVMPPAEQPNGFILEKKYVDRLLATNGANAIVIQFGISGADGQLKLVVKPIKYSEENTNKLLPDFERTVKANGDLIATSSVEPGPKCCP